MMKYFNELLQLFRKRSLLEQLVVLSFLAAAVIYGGTKSTNGVPPQGNAPRRVSGGNVNEGFTSEDLNRGFILSRIGTNEVFDFSAPENAVVCDEWRKRGAAYDWKYYTLQDWTLPCGTGRSDRVRIFSDGRLQTLPATSNYWWKLLQGTMGIVPEANWGLLTNRPSLFWMAETDYGSVLFTWQNVLLNRLPETPISFQAEFMERGKFVYRYDLSHAGVEEVSNVLCGVSLGGESNWITNSLASNVTSLSFYSFSDDDLETTDRDGDGISTADEILVYHTDPDCYDTDGDGIGDGEELLRGTDPLNPDSDGDLFLDGTDFAPRTVGDWSDNDGDGLPDDWKNAWFGTNAVDLLGDANGDGISNLASLHMGVDPVGSVDGNFEFKVSAYAPEINAYEIVPNRFDFNVPSNLTTLLMRTMTVGRNSPWQQLFVSANPYFAEGWNGDGIRLRYGFDDEPVTNEVPCVSADSWRIPIASDMTVSNVTFTLSAEGGHVALSRSLYLLRWTPHIKLIKNKDSTLLEYDGRSPIVEARRKSDTCRFEIPYVADFSNYPHRKGMTDDVRESLQLPPVEGLACNFNERGEKIFVTSNPLFATLPQEGRNDALRICCWEVERNDPGEIGAGPRSSRYAAPYPLSTSSRRSAYNRALAKPPSTGSVLTVFPQHPLVVLQRTGNQVMRAPGRMKAKSSTNDYGCSCSNGCTTCSQVVIDGVPGPYSCACEESPDEENDDYKEDEEPHDDCDDEDDCTCGDEKENSTKCQNGLGSFCLRVPLGKTTSDGLYGYVWTKIENPAFVMPSDFKILGDVGVTAVTNNTTGGFTVTCARPGGKTVAVTRVDGGVDLSVTNASGRFEYRWEIRNDGWSDNRIRARRMTIGGNATADSLYVLNDLYEYGCWLSGNNRVTGITPLQRSIREDNILNVRSVKTKWAHPDEPDFVTDVFDEKYLNGDECVSAVMSEYDMIGYGTFACRRLTCRHGFDEKGDIYETCTYWNDGESKHRHGRLKSLRSNRKAWSFHDYDSLGRETIRIEQLDGSPFPEDLYEVTLDASLPRDCTARAYVTSYEPLDDDSRNRNDRDLPRIRETYLMRGGRQPVLIQTETWKYIRSSDAIGIPLRTCTHTSVHGADATIQPATDFRTEYPDGDYAVPVHLRGRIVSEINSDGVTTATTWTRGEWNPETRTFTTSAGGALLRAVTRRMRGSITDKTYDVEISELSRQLIVHEETRLTDDDTLIDHTTSSYDDVSRLRSRTYHDGTSETNAYSCCRLLWSQDRRGRTTLRSARTGTDSLYYANEEVWHTYADAGTMSEYQVTQHWFDGLGRKTDTVVCKGLYPGEFADAAYPSEECEPVSLGRCTYWNDGMTGGCASECYDDRGKRTCTWSMNHEDSEITIICEKDAEEEGWFWFDTYGVPENKTERKRNGDTVITKKSSDGDWTQTTHHSAWGEDGLLTKYEFTEASDITGIVTNSVSRHDAYGRIATITTPLGMTSNVYDGVSSRMIKSVFLSGTLPPRDIISIHDEMGDAIGTVVYGITNRTDVTYVSHDDATWKRTTQTTEGTSTNSVSVLEERLTGFDAWKVSESHETGADGVETTKTVDRIYPGDNSDIIETTTSSVASLSQVRRICGLPVFTMCEDSAWIDYDAFGNETCKEIWPQLATGMCSGDSYIDHVSEYDAFGNVTNRITFHQSGTNSDVVVCCESREYDWKGRCVRTVNATGAETVIQYDDFDRVVATSGATYPVQFEYDTQGRRTALRTTRNGTTWDETCWNYDPATGLCTSKRYDDGSTVAYTYTSDGLPLRTTYASGKWKKCVYDSRRNLTGMVYSSPAMQYEIQRDEYNKPVSATDAAGNAWRYSYAVGSILTNEVQQTNGRTNVLARSIDEYKRPTGYSFTVNGVAKGGIAYDYDANGMIGLVTVTNDEGRAFTVSYTNHSGRCCGTTLTTPDGMTLQRDIVRDWHNRSLINASDTFTGAVLHSSYHYTYDESCRPIMRNDDAFTYDNRDQIASALIGTNSFAHTYDEIGNHVISVNNTTPNLVANNALNQTTSFGGESITWNTDGGMESDANWQYEYDADDRLITITSRTLTNGAIRVRNVYDYRNRRISKKVDRYDSFANDWCLFARYDFVWDDWNIIHETATSYNSSVPNVSEIQYFWGQDISGTLQDAGGVGGLLAVSSNGQFYFPVYDNNGNVMKYVDELGNVVASYRYDDFGATISQTGLLAGSFAFGFSTKYHDREINLIAYQLRNFKPSQMCWINRDPIEEVGGINLYQYCVNNPVMNIDTNGCAYFAVRKLDSKVMKHFSGFRGGILDRWNIELVHEHLFYEDNGKITNQGYFNTSKVDSEKVTVLESNEYIITHKGFDDCIMREAVKNVSPKPYSLLGSITKEKYNCQNWAEEVRIEYERIKGDLEVIKRCCKKGNKKGNQK